MGSDAAAGRLVVGCMTGTSIDGVDVALVRLEGEGLAVRPSFVDGESASLGELGPRLRAVAEQQPVTAGEIAEISRELSLLHARVIEGLLKGRRAELIAVHGQTVFHRPPASWQLFQPAVLARAAGVPVVCDLRGADLAAGGQGAPITPLADWLFLRRVARRVAVVNLGGFCNVTLLGEGAGDGGAGEGTDATCGEGEGARDGAAETTRRELGTIRGLDVCACNHVLDTVARRTLGVPFDDGGATALSGKVDDEALDDLLGVLTAAGRSGRSLGTGDEAMSWIGRHRSRVAGADLAATACEAIGQCVARVVISGPRGGEADAAAAPVERVLLAGGGARNRALVGAIASAVSCKVERTDEHGLPGEFREAAAMAVLGDLCAAGVAITLPRVTGVAVAPVAGVWCFPPTIGPRAWGLKQWGRGA